MQNPRVDSSAGNSCSAKKATSLVSGGWPALAANDFAQKEQPPYVEGLRDAIAADRREVASALVAHGPRSGIGFGATRVSGAIPHGGELVGAYLQAGFFPDFS
jgi:hypothetical protein